VSAEQVSAEQVSAEQVSAEQVSAEQVSAEQVSAEQVSAEPAQTEGMTFEQAMSVQLQQEEMWSRSIDVGMVRQDVLTAAWIVA